MINRRALASMAMAASLAVSPTIFAAPMNNNGPLKVKAPKVKMISFSMRNSSASTVKVMAGTSELTIGPGKTVTTKLSAGEKIVAEDGLSNAPAGTVLVVMGDQLKDATIVLK